jgi:excisionase family DNA binding protein
MQLLRVARVKIYELIENKEIDGIKVGADWKIRTESVEKIVGEIPTEFFSD